MGSASALISEDVIFAQYRESGVFQQRGFTLKEFMSQLFANRNDLGKGRNMPVHYGSQRLNIVSFFACLIYDVTLKWSSTLSLPLSQHKFRKLPALPTPLNCKAFKIPTSLRELWPAILVRALQAKETSTLR